MGPVLVGDGTEETADAIGPDGCKTAVGGGGEGASVVLGEDNFYSCGDSVEDEAATAVLQGVLELAVVDEVLGGGDEGGGELAAEGLGDLDELFWSGAADEDGVGSEDFLVEAWIGEEGGGWHGGEGRGFAVWGMVGGGELLDLGLLQCGIAVGAVGFGDAGVEHGAGLELIDAGGECLGKLVEGWGLQAYEDAGVGTELAHTEGDGGGVHLGGALGVGGELVGEEEDGVDAAHLGEDGDGLGAGIGVVKEGFAALE